MAQPFVFPQPVDPAVYGTNPAANIMQGFNMVYQPKQMQSQMQMDALKKAQLQQQNQSQPQMDQAKLALLQAQTQKANQGQSVDSTLTGDIGNAVQVENMAKQYGENDPRVIAARAEQQRSADYQQSLLNYRSSLADTAPQRAASPLGKLDLEAQDINEGYLPGTKNTNNPIKLTQEEQQKFKDRYDLAVLKSTTDPMARQKAIYATNLDKTIDSINPDDLFAFTGPSGSAKLALEKAKSLAGKQSPQYDRYMAALNAVEGSSQQYRQFTGSSVQPEEMQNIRKLINGATPLTDRKTADSMFNAYKKLMKNETNTYFDTLRGPQVLQGTSQGQKQPTVQNQSQQNTASNMDINSAPNDHIVTLKNGKQMTVSEYKKYKGMQ